MTLAEAVVDRLATSGGASGLAVLRAVGLDNVPGLEMLLDHAETLLHKGPDQALMLGALCDQASGSGARQGIRARARYQRAQVLAERGELEAALDLIHQARRCWLEAGDALAALRTDLGRMQVLDDLGRHSAAIEAGEELIDALAGPQGNHHLSRRIRAHATDNLGVAYGLVGRHQEALEAYARAEAAYRELGMADRASRPAANRGVELLALGRPRDALSEFTRAIDGFQAHGDRLFAAQCQGDLAQAHRQLGDVAEALRLLEQGRRTLDELGAAAEAARLRLALAETYLWIGLGAEARSAATVAAQATGTSGMRHDTALACFLVALADLARGLPGEALVELDRAEALCIEVDDPQLLARTRLARAEAALRSGSCAAAREQLAACVEELWQARWPIPLVWALLLQSEVEEDLAIVEPLLTRARSVAEGLAMPEISYRVELRTGRLRRRQRRLSEAESHLRDAIAARDRVGGDLPDHALLTTYRSRRMDAHVELVDLLLTRGQGTDIVDACRVADQSKAQTLTDLLTQAAGRGPALATAGSDLVERFAALGSAYRAQHDEADPRRGPALRRHSDVLEEQFDALRLRHLASTPLPGTSSRTPKGTPSNGAPVPTVAYSVVGYDIVAFVLSRGDTTVRRLPGALRRLHDLLDSLGNQWNRYSLGLGLGLGPRQRNRLLHSARADLADLYTLLFAPLTDMLGATDDMLRVVPHGPMGAVPFQALFDGERYLVERCAISVAPTLVAAGGAELGYAASDHALVVGVQDEYARSVGAEARLVHEQFPQSTLLLEAEATAAAFARSARDARVVHLATHGVFRANHPLFSRLRLGDRWMTAGEIVELDLRGALVTLSACESGAHGRAAEAVGLGWAFLAAGAGGLLVSQWPVHDEVTLELMSRLYDQLVTGISPATALQRAQLQVAESSPHPFMWAPFTYVRGFVDPDPEP